MTVERYALETNTGKNYYAALYHTAMTISSSIELDQVLENIVEGVTKAMGARATTLHLRDQESGLLRVGATYGLSAEYLQKRPLNAPFYIGNGQDCSDGNKSVRFQYQDGELVPALCASLRVYDEPIGMINVYTDAPVTFQDEDKQFLSILASLAAQAIENARLYNVARSSYDGMVNAFLGI